MSNNFEKPEASETNIGKKVSCDAGDNSTELANFRNCFLYSLRDAQFLLRFSFFRLQTKWGNARSGFPTFTLASAVLLLSSQYFLKHKNQELIQHFEFSIQKIQLLNKAAPSGEIA